MNIQAHTTSTTNREEQSRAHNGPPREHRGEGGLSAPSFDITEAEFESLRELIHAHAGIALGDGKKQLLVARLSRRLRALGLTSFTQYHGLLTSGDPSGDEMRRMLNCVTTNQTDFFREKHHFEFLKDRVLSEAKARAQKGGGRKLRVWSAGCSTGEEAYTIAITLVEAFGPSSGWDLKILASDIDTQVLATAEQGIYPEHRIQSLPEAVKRAHFLRGKGESEGLVRVRPELQKLVTFRRINFIESPWPIQTTFDVIFCRNVIIYFDRETQRRLFQRMREKIAPHGYLFVGHSENLYWLRDIFQPVQSTVYIPNST